MSGPCMIWTSSALVDHMHSSLTKDKPMSHFDQFPDRHPVQETGLHGGVPGVDGVHRSRCARAGSKKRSITPRMTFTPTMDYARRFATVPLCLLGIQMLVVHVMYPSCNLKAGGILTDSP